jgi:membrane-bound serine protease (ClpP class)
VAVASIIFFLGVLSYAVKAQLSKVRTGREGMVGEVGVARSDIAPSGKVFLHGELWDARAEDPVEAGERVVVIAVEGMMVKVRKEGRT